MSGVSDILALLRPIKVNFSTHAVHMLDERGIKKSDMALARKNDPNLRVRVDQRTGNTIYAAPGFHIAAKRDHDEFEVVAVVNADEFPS